MTNNYPSKVSEYDVLPGRITIEKINQINMLRKRSDSIKRHNLKTIKGLKQLPLNDKRRGAIGKLHEELAKADTMLDSAESIRKEIICGNLRLVMMVLKKFNIAHKTDLIQDGNIGLIKAVDSFDTSLGYTFSTYAYKLIYHHMISSINSQNIILTQSTVQRFRIYSRSLEILEQEGNFSPSNVEIANTMNSISTSMHIVPKSIDRFRKAAAAFNTKFTNELFISDRHIEDFETEYDNNVLLTKVGQALKFLTNREYDIIISRYSGISFANLAIRYNLSNMTIRNIHKDAIRTLRHVIDIGAYKPISINQNLISRLDGWLHCLPQEPEVPSYEVSSQFLTKQSKCRASQSLP